MRKVLEKRREKKEQHKKKGAPGESNSDSQFDEQAHHQEPTDLRRSKRIAAKTKGASTDEPKREVKKRKQHTEKKAKKSRSWKYLIPPDDRCCFVELPEEVIFTVFTFLDPVALYRVAMVCTNVFLSGSTQTTNFRHVIRFMQLRTTKDYGKTQ